AAGPTTTGPSTASPGLKASSKVAPVGVCSPAKVRPGRKRSHPAASKTTHRKVTVMDYRNRHVVITGGSGALGTAVVSALVAAGAVCHVPYLDEEKIRRFPHRGNDRVRLIPGCDLTDEAAVARAYDGVDDLWASIHIAGGFAMGPLAETDKARFMAMIDMNLV